MTRYMAQQEGIVNIYLPGPVFPFSLSLTVHYLHAPEYGFNDKSPHSSIARNGT